MFLCVHKAALVDSTSCGSVGGHRGALDLGWRLGERPAMCFVSAGMNFINLESVRSSGMLPLSSVGLQSQLFLFTRDQQF